MPRKQIEVHDAEEDDGEKRAPLRHNKKGEELLDDTPIALPLGYKKQPSLYEMVQHQVRVSKMEALQEIEETEEDADDFQVGDDYEPLSKYENDHIPTVKSLKAQALEINRRIEEANRRAAIAAHEKALKPTFSNPEGKAPPERTQEPTPPEAGVGEEL